MKVHPDTLSAHKAEIQAIHDLLGVDGRFVLASVVCDDLSVEREVIGELRQSTPGISVVHVEGQVDAEPFSLAERGIKGDPSAVFVTGLTGWLSEVDTRQQRVRALNASRERWIERFRCPVLLWMNHTTAQILAQNAPDLWRYRSHRFEFDLEPSYGASANSLHALGVMDGHLQSTSAEEARERIAELRLRLESLPADASPSLVAHAKHWRNEVAALLFRLGEVDDAELAWREALEWGRRSGDLSEQASALGNLGLIAETRGDLEGAERLYRESLEIDRKLGRLEGQANQLGNLGGIAWTRGDLEGAERLMRESLEIDRKLGRLEGQASDLGNLGLIARTRGDLEGAEKLHRESLEIERKLGRLEGRAASLGNLGLIAKMRGDLEGAEKLHRESLEISRKLGSLEGQAASLGNLGVIARTRGDLEGAEKLYRESLEINRKLGRLEGQAIQLGNLGVIARTRGDLEGAEKLHRESLEMERQLGSLEGQADQLGNLGVIAQKRGDFAEARRLWMESRELYAKVGIPHMVKMLQGWLDGLPGG